MVATIGDADSAQPAPAAAKAAPPPPQEEQHKEQQAPGQPRKAPAPAAAPAAAAPAAAAPSAPAVASHRAPAIAFPPRRTPEGELISALPPDAAKQLLASMLGGDSGGNGSSTSGIDGAPATASSTRPPVPEQYKHMIAVPIVGGSMPTLRGMPVPAGPPGPPRRTMTDAEMEAIMLGGAEP